MLSFTIAYAHDKRPVWLIILHIIEFNILLIWNWNSLLSFIPSNVNRSIVIKSITSVSLPIHKMELSESTYIYKILMIKCKWVTFFIHLFLSSFEISLISLSPVTIKNDKWYVLVLAPIYICRLFKCVGQWLAICQI